MSWLGVRHSNSVEYLRRSTWRNQLANGFQLVTIWSPSNSPVYSITCGRRDGHPQIGIEPDLSTGHHLASNNRPTVAFRPDRTVDRDCPSNSLDTIMGYAQFLWGLSSGILVLGI